MATHADWLSLVQRDGLVVSEPVLEERFPGGPLPVGKGLHNWFRRQAERVQVSRTQSQDKRVAGARRWIDFLLHTMLEIDDWKKGPDVPSDLRVFLSQFDQELRPDRALSKDGKPVMLVSIVEPDQSLDRRDRQPGRWKASPTTKLDRLLRETGTPLGLVTNGEDLRLLYAPPGMNTGAITWTTRALVEEKATLDAFCALLGRESLVPDGEDATTLADLCRMSLDRQADVADQLGDQVRNGLERLLWAWDAADRDVQGELFEDTTESELYEMGLVVMMRLVFLLYAEERDLLPHGEILYDQGYGLTYLWHSLLDRKRTDEARMRETYDAWDRFLATGRLVHRGCGHPDLSLIAYGGRLFDPARFPVLEDPRCKVSNRTFYDVIQLLLFARQRKGGEPQRVGYWAIDVEQIGYIYEGLLDHRCARAGGEPVVKLRGAGEEAMPLPELEKLDRDQLVALVVSASGRKEQAVRDALDRDPDPKDLEALKAFPAAVVERVVPFAPVVQCGEVVPPGWRYLTTGTSRRASGAHYTPQSLTERIVRVTLEPLVYRNVEGKPGLLVEPRQVKSPRELLALRVCDIAMGSGAFLVQAVRYLGDRLVEAWDRALAASKGQTLAMPYAEAADEPEADRPIDPEQRVEMILWARRYVAERCIYGVDVNPLAVEMAKLSLWLTTLAKDRPFTFLDHALRCGDSLVGVDLEQLTSWSLDGEGEQQEVLQYVLKKAVREAVALRRELQSIAVVEAADLKRKAALLEKANAGMARARIAADLLIAPWFGEENVKKRRQLRDALLNRVTLASRQKDWDELEREARGLLGEQRTFHWALEFPEVFLGDEGGGFDAIVGNPPFMGGLRIGPLLGNKYRDVLLLSRNTHGNADLCAHFFRAAFALLRNAGAFGLVATNTIGQGHTRETGLSAILEDGGTIRDAITSFVWPGPAAVQASSVVVCKGPSARVRLDNRTVCSVDSSLHESESTLSTEPYSLAANLGLGAVGSYPYGDGFLLSDSEVNRLLALRPNNSNVIKPYCENGRALNLRPVLKPETWIIDFGEMSEEEAACYPECFAIVKRRVRPVRLAQRRERRSRLWWRYAETAKELYSRTSGLKRMLVRAMSTCTMACRMGPTGWVYDQTVVCFALDSWTAFGVLSSALHNVWALRRGGTIRADPRYNVSRCFDTFPFPCGSPSVRVGEVESTASNLSRFRDELMQANNEGLTKTYNRFHDPNCNDPGILRLRELHVEMDNAVRDAYGWSDLDLGHDWIKTVTTEEKKDRKTGKVKTVEKVEWRYTISEDAKQEILRRLLKLNHEIHEREVAEGLHDKKKPAAKKKAPPSPKKGRGGKKKEPNEGQGSLF